MTRMSLMSVSFILNGGVSCKSPDFQPGFHRICQVIDMVALHGGDAFHSGKEGDGLDDVAGHFDGDAGDDAVFVNNLGTIGLDSAKRGPLPISGSYIMIRLVGETNSTFSLRRISSPVESR